MNDKSIKQKRRHAVEKFLYYFPAGYRDEKYIAWERGYKWEAHRNFEEKLNKRRFSELLRAANFREIAETAVRIESRTNLLFSFEKMALRDALKSTNGRTLFARGLFDYLYGKRSLEKRFDQFVETVASLPRKQTRVLTWPLVTAFGFIGRPDEHIFVKPRVTQRAAEKFAFDFKYESRPNWNTYVSALAFAEAVRKETAGLKPQDHIDLQSFIWVQGSDEYPD